MSSVLSAEPVPAPQQVSGPGLGFARLVRVELRKQVDTRGGRWLIGVIIGLTALALAVLLWMGRHDGVGFEMLFSTAFTPQGLLLPVLGIVTACNEWSQRTALITFTQEPRRWRVVLAKIVAALLLGTLVYGLAFVLAGLCHVGSMAFAGQADQIKLGMSAGLFAKMWLAQMLTVLQGVGFGLALLSVPVAVAAYFIAPMVFMMLRGLVKWLAQHGMWLDMVTATSPLASSERMTTLQWEQLGTASLLWIGLPLAIGFWRVLTREVK